MFFVALYTQLLLLRLLTSLSHRMISSLYGERRERRRKRRERGAKKWEMRDGPCSRENAASAA